MKNENVVSTLIFEFFGIRGQMPWNLSCLTCACEPATTKGEEGKEESVK